MTSTERRIAEAKQRMQALKAALAANADATEADKVEMFRAHGFRTRNTLL